ncbi:hypothetical protein [Salinithrix halophila]|uniref:Uncharacterized protein n=1 Tax=Salinithrix halophila TaxID=1485204 RepID=A0ABV8JAD7_9BACL
MLMHNTYDLELYIHQKQEELSSCLIPKKIRPSLFHRICKGLGFAKEPPAPASQPALPAKIQGTATASNLVFLNLHRKRNPYRKSRLRYQHPLSRFSDYLHPNDPDRY